MEDIFDNFFKDIDNLCGLALADNNQIADDFRKISTDRQLMVLQVLKDGLKASDEDIAALLFLKNIQCVDGRIASFAFFDPDVVRCVQCKRFRPEKDIEEDGICSECVIEDFRNRGVIY